MFWRRSRVPLCRGFRTWDWTPLKRELTNKVLLLILGEQYGTVLEQQDIRLVAEEGGFVVTYGHHRLPSPPPLGNHILSFCMEALVERLGENPRRCRNCAAS